MENARQLEQQGELEGAARLYESVIKSTPADEHPYNRLMIIYRKLKRAKDELRVINAGIAAFEATFKRTSKNKKLTELSNKMMKTAGLTNSKGKPTFYPEPINKWMKRKQVVERKVKDD